MLKCFTLRDTAGNMWNIPAEDVPTRFPGHYFMVHKALQLDDPHWVVTHCGTGAAVARGESRKEAVDKAQRLLASCSLDDLENAIMQSLVYRDELIAREYRRAGLHVPDAAGEHETSDLARHCAATSVSAATACAAGVHAY